jgi:3-oxoacid CoA-transferase
MYRFPRTIHCLLLTSEDTFIQEGKIPVRLQNFTGLVHTNGDLSLLNKGVFACQQQTMDGSGIMEEALTGDVAILRAWKADEAGNCVFR